jgi:hypothetical protein
MHPELWAAGYECMGALKESYATPELFEDWVLPFNAVSIVSNRESLFHRDNDTRPEFLDLLVSCGFYEKCVLEKPGLGLRFFWPPGSLSAFSGKLIRHGVSAADGERAALALYMRDSVQEKFGVKSPSWTTTRR